MRIKLMKIKGLLTSLVSNIFALLRGFSGLSINSGNNSTSAARIIEFLNTSGAPLADAAGYPKLLRPRRRFCEIGARKPLAGVSEQ
jgi:hypothetical protein